MTGPLCTDQISHTPGPWTIDPATGLDIRGPYGKDVAVSLCQEMGGLQFDSATIGPEHRQQAFDNALLIAAAPELLAVIHDAMDLAIEADDDEWWGEWIESAKALIAKAEGRL